jgi:hypothetical protein
MRRAVSAALASALVALGLATRLPAQTRPDVSGLSARVPADWVRDAVVYELNVRTFTEAGTFAWMSCSALTTRPGLNSFAVTARTEPVLSRTSCVP